MTDPTPASPEVLQALGVIGYEVAFALLGRLSENGILSTRDGLRVIEQALASVEEKQRETPTAALQIAIDLLGIHQAMFVKKGGG